MKNIDNKLLMILTQLKDYGNIAVIYSGNPEESANVLFRSNNPRGWKSYLAVAEDIRDALVSLGFKNVYLMPENRNLSANLAKLRIDFAWCNTAGIQGLDSSCHCVSLLESLGIPYVGHSPSNTVLLDNKHLFKYMLGSQGIATADFITWHPRECGNVSEAVQFNEFIRRTGGDGQLSDDYPRYVVKPVTGRASLNIVVAQSPRQLPQLCQQVYDVTGNTVLVEQYLAGNEYCVAVMGNITCERIDNDNWHFRHNPYPVCFSHFERRLDDSSTIATSMDVKPISADSIIKLESESSHSVIDRLNDIGRNVFCNQGLYNLIRLDLRMNSEGKLHVLEANPKPDLKMPTKNATSLVSMGLEELRMDYDAMILSQIVNTLDYLYRYRPIFAERIAGLETMQSHF